MSRGRDKAVRRNQRPVGTRRPASGFEANQARLKIGVLVNLLHIIRQFYERGEEIKRSMDWLIKLLSTVRYGKITGKIMGSFVHKITENYAIIISDR